jgi:hypothetical protein
VSANESQRGPRRVFIEAHELPGLLAGLVRGEARSLRRILGARRGGRYGVGLAALGLVLAAHPRHWPALLAAHAVLSLVGLPLQRRHGLSPRENQRLALWWLGMALALCALPRALGAPELPVAMAAVALAQIGHARNLNRGFAS